MISFMPRVAFSRSRISYDIPPKMLLFIYKFFNETDPNAVTQNRVHCYRSHRKILETINPAGCPAFYANSLFLAIKLHPLIMPKNALENTQVEKKSRF